MMLIMNVGKLQCWLGALDVYVIVVRVGYLDMVSQFVAARLLRV